MSGAFPLPHPYIVGEHQPDSFEDRTQQNLDALAIAIGNLSARIGGGVPIGAVIAWSRKSIPADWVLADGSWLNEADYPQAYAVGVAEVAAGNPEWQVDTTLRRVKVPDLRDRFIYGQGAKALGTRGGAETHTLTVAEMPSHNHGGTTSVAGEHNHLAGDRKYNGASGTAIAYLDVVGSGGQPWGTGWAGDHSHTISSQGGGAPHNNMPPYVVLAYLIKVAGSS